MFAEIPGIHQDNVRCNFQVCMIEFIKETVHFWSIFDKDQRLYITYRIERCDRMDITIESLIKKIKISQNIGLRRSF